MSQLPEFSNDANAEQYIKKHILGQPASQEHAEMTLQAVKRLCEFDGTHWNHAACHLLERYQDKIIGPGQRREDHDRSLLYYLAPETQKAFPQYREALDMIVAKASTKSSCLDRVLGPIFSLNIAEDRKNPGQDRFCYDHAAFKDPDSVQSKMPEVRLMMGSAGPAEMWRRAKEHSVPLCGDIHGVPCLEAYTGASLSDKELEEYLIACHGEKKVALATGGMTAADIAKMRHVPIDENVVPGVFVDVDDTLLVSGADGYELSEIHGFLQRIVAHGEPKVTVFSGGDPEKQTERLIAAGVDLRLLPVQPKSDFHGKTLQYLIDDTEPSLSGFRAQHYERAGGYERGLQDFIISQHNIAEVVPQEPAPAAIVESSVCESVVVDKPVQSAPIESLSAGQKICGWMSRLIKKDGNREER